MSNEIDKDVLKAIKRCECEGNRMNLNEDRLASEFRDRIIRIMEKLGGKWRVSLKAFDFEFDPKPLLDEIMATGMVPVPMPLDYFDTPPRLATRMVDMMPPEVTRVLEPSAGDGNIVKEILGRFPTVKVHALELSLMKWGKLRKVSDRMIAVQQDFLTFKQPKGYECIVMTPPLASKRNPLEWVEHFHYAFNMLIEKGTLIGVAPIGLLYSAEARVRGLRSMIENNHGLIEPLSPKMFKIGDNYIATALVKVVRC